jgi:hypothetical protein
MISRAMVLVRPACARVGVLAAVASAGVALALGVIATGPAWGAAACPNEAIRRESNINPATGEPYSVGLPDCRAYEMVSPLYKQGHDVTLEEGNGIGLPAAADGDTVGFVSEGDFSNPENYAPFDNPYLSQRGESEWITSSAFAPRSLIYESVPGGLRGDTAPDLRSVRVSCGASSTSAAERNDQSVVCAVRKPDGSWVGTPAYPSINGEGVGLSLILPYRGASADLSRLIIQPVAPLLSKDTLFPAGIYEIVGAGRLSPQLRVLNVDQEGNELSLLGHAPFLGGFRSSSSTLGTSYHAISETGGTTFFTAGATTQEVYARVNCGNSPAPTCKEVGNGERFETVKISEPSPKDCSKCTGTPQAAVFQGASADGSKVFFTTRQTLLNGDASRNLYEYDFNGHEGGRVVLVSGAPEGKAAEVEGVVRSSPDGSHIYFVATGVLTGEEANGNGEKAAAGTAHLYGYDTVTQKIKFVANTSIEGAEVTKDPNGVFYAPDNRRHAQTTPDGEYLVFSTEAKLINTGDTNTMGCPEHCPRAVYRYNFQTGDLTWISHGAGPPGTPAPDEGHSAIIAPLPGEELGGYANIDDWNRAISGCPTKGERSESEAVAFNCPEGKYDGEYIWFTTSERLQAGTIATNVYEWHNGTVSMISDGRDPNTMNTSAGSGVSAAMSASGSDIYFITHTRLVGQDTDVLVDLYDARMNREAGVPSETGRELAGFPAPRLPLCSAEACQGSPSALPSFPSAASSLFTAGRNVIPAALSVSPATDAHAAAPLTRAQQLAKALKACKMKPTKRRRLCESQARKRYGPKASRKARARSHARGG